MKIIVSGYMIRFPLAGMMLAFFHYVLGLERLGHDVIYVEESGWPDSCYDPKRGLFSDDPSVGMAAVEKLLLRFGLKTPLCFVNRETGQSAGMSRRKLGAHLQSADLLLNVGGTCRLPEFDRCRRRVLIDMDPMFTQAGAFAGQYLDDYDVLFSYGTNIGTPACGVPTLGLEWRPTVPPVAEDLFAEIATRPAEIPAMTTVCNWSAYGGIEHEGVRYGQKDEEFIALGDLPSRSPVPLEMAVSGIDDTMRNRLELWGWHLRDAAPLTADLDSYLGYIAQSRGEFSVAKNAYVKTGSGWFSDRSVCYLAAGRPVVLQDTGASRNLPESSAVLKFAEPGQALNCLADLQEGYESRCRSALAMARDVFGCPVVLPALLDAAFSSKPRAADASVNGKPDSG